MKSISAERLAELEGSLAYATAHAVRLEQTVTELKQQIEYV